MNKTIRVLIHGTGFAGQGHTEAFRFAGAEVVGIVGRTESVTREVANDMDIPYAGTDWEQALTDLQPDIVSIGTPGGAHFDAIKSAIAHGCHIFCDKPMTVDGQSAETLYQLAEEKQLKTAYAASFRYMPHVLFAKRLVAQGAIGEPQEVECMYSLIYFVLRFQSTLEKCCKLEFSSTTNPTLYSFDMVFWVG